MSQTSTERVEDLPGEFSWRVWDLKYRWHQGPDLSEQRPLESWRRVASAIAAVEPRDGERHAQRFFDELSSLRFLPGGRILAGAGTGRQATLLNCFVLGVIDDSIEGIFHALEEAALTMQRGGGVGLDFSTLRPRGSTARRTGTIASGPVPFMKIFDTTCEVLLSTSPRRGAMMATLRCDHPDIEMFITAKARGGALPHFNLSVQVSEEFVAAVRSGEDWPLLFPAEELAGGPGELLPRRWTGSAGPVPCRVLARIPARKLWDLLVESAHRAGEPGVLFVDRINRENNLWYREHLTCTNPCGEVPLPPYGACDLGSVNLVQFVREPFRGSAWLDLDALDRTIEVGVRFLDDVLDASPYPLEREADVARGTRRIGLGLTGLADALILLGRRYDQPEGREVAAAIARRLRDTAYRASIALAREKGPFPSFERERFLEGDYARRLPADIRSGISECGLRNAQLIAIAPAGSISLLAGNVSSGIEPLFALEFHRRLIERDGAIREHPLAAFSLRRWRELEGVEAGLPSTFIDAQAMSPQSQLEMQAALQPYVDGSIAKTINLPAGYPLEEFRPLFGLAHDRGLKGCTVFPSCAPSGAVLAKGHERS